MNDCLDTHCHAPAVTNMRIVRIENGNMKGETSTIVRLAIDSNDSVLIRLVKQTLVSFTRKYSKT